MHHMMMRPPCLPQCSLGNPLGVATGPAGDRVRRVSRRSHDTISMVAIDRHGNIAAGSSTNGASHKVPSNPASPVLRLPHQHQLMLCQKHVSAFIVAPPLLTLEHVLGGLPSCCPSPFQEFRGAVLPCLAEASSAEAPQIAAQIPGRMSDSAVAGAGAYAETGVGGCGSTGDGDIHLRFLPCYQVRRLQPATSPC